MGNYDIGYENMDGEINPPIIQGATYQLPFTVTNVFAAGGVGCTLTGNVVIGVAAPVSFTGRVLSVTADILSCILTLSATVTLSMNVGSGYFTTKIADSSGFVLEPLQGKAKVTL
jgi:hypothetical protein